MLFKSRNCGLDLAPLKPRTEQFLYLMLWSAEQLTRPTFRNLTESFEGWAYRSGLFRHLASLEKQRLVERRAKEQRVYRLTEKGRLRALGGRDPEAHWSRTWDGWWRLVCFDLPVTENAQRERLRQFLRNQGFGVLQRSLWISPDPIDEQARLLKTAKANVESLIFFQARACGGEENADVVEKAWDFDRINDLYRRHLKILEQKPSHRITEKIQATALLNWAEAERLAWRRALDQDPLLPESLLPRGYLGKRAWARRVDVLRLARRAIGAFEPRSKPSAGSK